MFNIWARIVEYATRDQAQNAVNTLSNQQLMGRLVYVREVSSTFRLNGQKKLTVFRIVKQSPVSLLQMLVVAVDSNHAEVSVVVVAVATLIMVVKEVVAEVVVSYILPMFVSPQVPNPHDDTNDPSYHIL